MTKTKFKSLESQTRQLFHAVLGPEYELYIKNQNIVKRRSNPVTYTLWAQNYVEKWSCLALKASEYGFDQLWPKLAHF